MTIAMHFGTFHFAPTPTFFEEFTYNVNVQVSFLLLI